MRNARPCALTQIEAEKQQLLGPIVYYKEVAYLLGVVCVCMLAARTLNEFVGASSPTGNAIPPPLTRQDVHDSEVGRHGQAIWKLQILTKKVVEEGEREGRREAGTWGFTVYQALERVTRRARDAKGDFFIPSYLHAEKFKFELLDAAAQVRVLAANFVSGLLDDEVAEYVGPLVIKRARGRKGLGLFLTEDVKADTVVLVERALAEVVRVHDGCDDWGEEEKEEAAIDLLDEGMVELYEALQRRASRNAMVNAQLLSLWPERSEEQGEEREIPPMELFRTRDPDTDVNAWLGKTVIGSEILRKVAYSNSIRTGKGARVAESALEPANITAEGSTAPKQELRMKGGKNGGRNKDKAMELSIGMWPLAAFMNQDMEYPTVGRVRVKQYLVVRASRDLKKGDELLTIYFEGQAAREGRSKRELQEARRQARGKGN